MTEQPLPEVEEAFFRALGALGPALLRSLFGFEGVARHLHPPAIESLRDRMAPVQARLEETLGAFEAREAPDGLAGMQSQIVRCAQHAVAAGELFGGASGSVERVLGAMHEHCRAQATAYPLRSALPAIGRYFLEEGCRDAYELFDAAPREDVKVGLFSASNGPEERGGFTLYVPETYDGSEARPLIVALHGGHGHGADFVFTWLREARSRGCLLIAPTSHGDTWSFNGPDVDGPALLSMVEHVAKDWRIDRERILLTGLSDGATYSLLHGFGEGMPYTALAPVSGVLHPLNLANGNIERARRRRVFLVHGALDWMFPVQIAREAADVLRVAGADLVYREVDDLSHAYPREENAAILDWLGGADLLEDGEQAAE